MRKKILAVSLFAVFITACGGSSGSIEATNAPGSPSTPPISGPTSFLAPDDPAAFGAMSQTASSQNFSLSTSLEGDDASAGSSYSLEPK